MKFLIKIKIVHKRNTLFDVSTALFFINPWLLLNNKDVEIDISDIFISLM